MCVINTAYFCNNSDWNSYNYAFNVFIKNVRMFSGSFSRFSFFEFLNSIRHTHTHNNYINALKVKKKIDLPPNGNSFLAKMGNSETDSHWICALQCVLSQHPSSFPLTSQSSQAIVPWFKFSSHWCYCIAFAFILYFWWKIWKNFLFPFHLIWWFFGISMCYCSTKFNRQTHA